VLPSGESRWRTLRTLITVGCFLIGTLILWRTFGTRAPTLAEIVPFAVPTAPLAPAPAAADGVRIPLIVAAAPSPLPTIAATDLPTIALAEPADAPALGAAPKGSDCPADHMVKGNIVDRGANKGDKIYHLPGDNGYAQTKPEQCFVDAKEAEVAGYRAVKK